MGRQQGWLTGWEPGSDCKAPAPSSLARLRSCAERSLRQEPLQKRKCTSSSELWPRPSARTGTNCERRRQPRAPTARARPLRPQARTARPPREGAGEGADGGGAGRGGWGAGLRALPLQERNGRPPRMRWSHAVGPGPASRHPVPLPCHLPGRWPTGGAGAGAGPSRVAGLRGARPRETSETLLSRTKVAKVGHRAGCTERQSGASGRKRASWWAQGGGSPGKGWGSRDQRGWASSWVGIRKGLGWRIC